MYTSTTDPHIQKQNPDECRIQVPKNDKNSILNQTGAPKYWWTYYYLLWIYISYYQCEHAHGGCYAYEVAFNTNTYPIQFTHSTLYNPLLYYYAKKDSPRTKEKLDIGSYSRIINLS